jgi:hypothetical protein
LRGCDNIRGQHGGCTKRLYQWLSQWASFIRSDTSGSGSTRTVRTEVTVERQAMAVLVGDVGAAGFDTCPLCGNKLTSAHAEHARLGLPQGSILEEHASLDRPDP